MSINKNLVEFAKKHPIFYVQPFLMGIVALGFALLLLGEKASNLWVAIPLLVIGGLINLAVVLLCFALLVTLGKSIAEDKKTAPKQSKTKGSK